MMKLPGADEAYVEREKLEDYLLSCTHPTGRFKARFFRSLGLRHAEDLEASLLEVARDGTVKSRVRTEYGIKYIVGRTASDAVGDLGAHPDGMAT